MPLFIKFVISKNILKKEWLDLFDRAGNKMTSYSSTVQTDLDKIKTVQDIINNFASFKKIWIY